MNCTMHNPGWQSRCSIDDGPCPYGDADTGLCSAALGVLVVGACTRRTYCLSDNYDSCPIFLSKMLRKRG
jgi:hypothetical protein